MEKQIFLNLPVSNLPRSMAFYEALGFTNIPQFTDDTAACMEVSGHIYLMLLTHPKFKTFTHKEIIDAQKTAGVLNSLSAAGVHEVDRFVDAAVHAGGREYRAPQDMGFMYLRCFEDPDGHNWEIFFMDMNKVPAP
jgi:predicted lactoylglutathione lyase